MKRHQGTSPFTERAARRRATGRGGFTLVEALIVVALLGLLMAMALPRFSRELRVNRVNQAAQVLASDLERAFTTAARQRKPVRLSWNNSAMQYSISDRASGTVLLARGLGTGNSSFGVLHVSFSASPLDIFPVGFASSALTVTLTAQDYSRRVQMTRAGLTLVGP